MVLWWLAHAWWDNRFVDTTLKFDSEKKSSGPDLESIYICT